MPDLRVCALIPTFDNPQTIGDVVREVRKHVHDVIVVDDGSHDAGRAAVTAAGDATATAEAGRTIVRRHERNRGKGAAVKTGFAEAHALGFSHALQIDADGQHCLDDIPRFLAAARERPEALILGSPVFDASQPRGRAFARKLSQFWVNVETGGRVIDDPQCGFRVYPIAEALAADARGDHMQFDQELPVRLVWRGVPVVNLPTSVRYLSREQGGVSHFRLWRDNVRISSMHTRLVLQKWFRRPTS